jgi:hypothetical protein
MSLELSVYCDRSKLPSAQQWSAAIKKDGFDLTFRALNWKKPDGAVTLSGDETHFELSLFPNDPDEDPPKPAARFDSLVAFRFGSTGGEAALLAAAALSRLTKGYLYDPDMDAPLKAADAVAEARRMLAPPAPAAKKKYEWSWDDQSLRGANWVAACEEQLRSRVHPDYRQNKTITRANLIEFLRRDESSGLVLSQNMVRKTFQGEEEYEHCFAVLPAEVPDLGPSYSPLKVGQRWSANETILRQIAVDIKGGFKHPSKPYAQTTNFKHIVHNAKAAETHLFPHYRKTFVSAAPRLVELVSLAQRIIERVGPKTKELTPAKAANALGVDVKVLNAHRGPCINLGVEGLKRSKRFAGIPAKVLEACIVGHNIEQFWAARNQLPQIGETLRRLRGKRR